MKDLFTKETLYLLISVFLALLPAIIWIKIWRSRKQIENRRDLTRVFLLGFLSIIPVVGFQHISTCTELSMFGVNIYVPCLPTGWNPLLFIESHTHNPTIKSALVFAVFAALEEIGKLSIVKYADFKGKHIKTINDSLMFSLVAALSFAFVENIIYFNNILMAGSVVTLYSVFIFRSVFTAAAHAVFSGIAGYHYGLGKFAKPIVETAYWKREDLIVPRLLNRFLGISKSSALKVQLVFKGLFIATMAHALFNFLLEKNEILWVVLLVVAGVFYIFHLIQRKSGALFLRMTNARPSTMAPKDEEVVLELIGMWSKEGKYEDVMEICERLLKRDPDNNIVRLFMAEAHQEKELKRAYKAVKALFTHEKIDFDESIFKKAKRKKN